MGYIHESDVDSESDSDCDPGVHITSAQLAQAIRAGFSPNVTFITFQCYGGWLSGAPWNLLSASDRAQESSCANRSSSFYTRGSVHHAGSISIVASEYGPRAPRTGGDGTAVKRMPQREHDFGRVDVPLQPRQLTPLDAFTTQWRQAWALCNPLSTINSSNGVVAVVTPSNPPHGGIWQLRDDTFVQCWPLGGPSLVDADAENYSTSGVGGGTALRRSNGVQRKANFTQSLLKFPQAMPKLRGPSSYSSSQKSQASVSPSLKRPGSELEPPTSKSLALTAIGGPTGAVRSVHSEEHAAHVPEHTAHIPHAVAQPGVVIPQRVLDLLAFADQKAMYRFWSRAPDLGGMKQSLLRGSSLGRWLLKTSPLEAAEEHTMLYNLIHYDMGFRRTFCVAYLLGWIEGTAEELLSARLLSSPSTPDFNRSINIRVLQKSFFKYSLIRKSVGRVQSLHPSRNWLIGIWWHKGPAEVERRWAAAAAEVDRLTAIGALGPLMD